MLVQLKRLCVHFPKLNMHMFALFDFPGTWLRFGLFALLLVLTSTRAEPNPERWGVAIQQDGVRGTEPLHLQLVAVEGDPLIGTFAADTLLPQESTKRISAMVIDGQQREDGTFWPNVELQIKMKPDGKWVKVASSLDEAVSAKLTIYGGMAVHGLLVNLEPFRGYTGKCQFGRVLLKSGQEAVVNLDYLTDRSKESSQTKKSD